MSERIMIMREATVTLTQMLAGKGVQVTQRGVSAFVRADKDGKPYLVNLPYIPDNADEVLLDAIQGFLDHEVAHILFTEFPLMEQAHKAGAGGMLNLIEDSRIEREMANRFQGSAENMARMGKFFLDKYTLPRMKEALKTGDTDTLVGVLTVPLVRMMAGQQIFAEFMKDKMHHVQDVYDKIKDLQPKIARVGSTRECLDLAKTIVKRLRDGDPAAGSDPDPSAPPPPKGAGGKSKGAGKASKPGKKDPDEEEKKDEEEGEGEEEGKPEDEEGEEEAAAAGGDEEADGDEGDGKGELASDQDEGDGEGGEAAGGPMTPPDPDAETDVSQSSAISWEAIDRETAKDYDDVASGLITDKATAMAKHAEYLVYSTDQDIIETMKVGSGYKDTMLTGLQDAVDHMVGPLQKDLERAIAAKSLSHWNPGHRSGRLNAAALSRLAVNDPRVFRRKTETTTKDVAVQLVVDMSGSMDGEKITTAAQSAYALAATLDRIGITSEVICFTTGMGYCGDLSTLHAEEAKIGRKFSRAEQLYMPILKGAGERMSTDVKKRFAWLPHCSSLRNNVDGESVQIAGHRLLSRKEKGKILIVLSDGAPHAYGETRTLGPHLKKVVENLTRAGVKVIGIGIQSSEVRKYYPKNFMINNVSELPSVVMKELRQLIAA
jgi:cobalamin biosynthesis protein CobT